jgi:hypothetical protein
VKGTCSPSEGRRDGWPPGAGSAVRCLAILSGVLSSPKELLKDVHGCGQVYICRWPIGLSKRRPRVSFRMSHSVRAARSPVVPAKAGTHTFVVLSNARGLGQGVS